MTRLTRVAAAAAELLGDVAGADGEGAAHALQAACDRIRTNLTPWVGEDGCTALLQRGLERARADHASLEGVALRGHPPRLEGLAELRGQPPAAAVPAAQAVLSQVVGQLSRLVGEDVALRLLLPGDEARWRLDPNEPSDDDSGDTE